jgi:hypothetical protein
MWLTEVITTTERRAKMRDKFIVIKIEQLDSNGNVYRTFTKTTRESQLDSALERIYRAYNMDHTRVTY